MISNNGVSFKFYKIIILSFVLAYWHIPSFSQNFDFKKFSTSNGLMSNQIDALFIDSKGMLWIANGNGVTRYNGNNFVNYLNDSMLTVVNKINAFSIQELKDGSIFYSMKYGYAKTSSNKRYYLDIFLSDTIALSDENGVTDKNGNRFFKSGVLEFDFNQLKLLTKKFSSYPDGHPFPSNLLYSNKGNVFYSFYNRDKDTRTLYLYSNNQFYKIGEDIEFIMSGIIENEKNYFILPDEYNSINPIIVINKNNLSKAYLYKSKDIADCTLFGNGLFYHDKIILPATNGIFMIDKKEQKFIPDNIMKTMNISDERFFTSLYKPVYLYNNYIVNGYRLLDIEKQEIVTSEIIFKEMSKENFITEVLPDQEGNLWYASFNGLFQLYPLPYQYLYPITENRMGEINDSIDNARFKCLQEVEYVDYCLTNDSAHIQILIPKIKDRFYKYDISTQKITPIYVQGMQSPVLKERLYPLMAYKKIIVCQEYTRGLVIYHLNDAQDTAYYHLFNYSNGLLSNYVENVFVDKNENVWIITWDGIQVIAYSDLLQENYDKALRFSQSFKLDMIPFKVQDDIYFSDATMLYKIPTTAFLYNKKPPSIIIESISYKHGKKQINLTFKQDTTYTLPYNFEELTIEASAVCLSDGSKVKYKYVLNATEHYQNEGNIILNDLPTGTHTLEIYASNNFNIWTPTPYRIYIEVEPPLWERWWFQISSVVLVISIVIFIIKKREYDLKQKQAELERLVNIRTKELSETNRIIEQKNTEILDSIHYTQRLQKSSLPSEKEFKKVFPDSFVLYMPKDIIAGDFYFTGIIRTNEGKILKGISVGDCTGHGVPGAFMSILLLAYIKQSLSEKDVNSPAESLEFISQKIQKVLEYKNQQDEVKDSADMVFAVVNEEQNTLWCACANNPVYIVRNSQLIELPAQKRTVGYSENTEAFQNQTCTLQKGDMLYFFSDGYPDQFGGKYLSDSKKKDKKFTKKRFKETILSIAHLDTAEQKEMLIKIHQEWKGDNEQTDDICIVGIRYS